MMEKDDIPCIGKKTGKNGMGSLQEAWGGQLDFRIVFIYLAVSQM